MGPRGFKGDRGEPGLVGIDGMPGKEGEKVFEKLLAYYPIRKQLKQICYFLENRDKKVILEEEECL